jgi:phosphoenolpyruvate-protein phosphotransferase (PTS system enzyme I)
MIVIEGIPAAGGIAIGPAFHYQQVAVAIERRTIQDPAAEWDRLQAAIDQALQDLDHLYDRTLEETGEETAAIFQSHKLMLQDPDLLADVRTRIEGQNLNAEYCLADAGEAYARILEGLQDEYFRARAADVRDVVGRVSRILLNIQENPAAGLTQPSIILARDLTPSDTVTLDKSLVLGFCIAFGGPTSHTAILSRELGLPAVVGAGERLLEIAAGSNLIMDGSQGKLFVEPDQETNSQYLARLEILNHEIMEARKRAHEQVRTRDGHRIEVAANVGGVEGASKALELGAEGIGLLRSEFLCLGQSHLLTEEEQYQAYRAIVDIFGELPVVLRTLDIGGDKELSYLDLPKEMNPFLGLRGIRLCLAKPELFKPQVRAALRAANDRNLKIMFPMIASVAEVRAAKEFLNQCRLELLQEGTLVPEKIEIGIMVEVPAAAIMADQLASEVDFFSIGTNDLSQYTMAADRTNSSVSQLSDAFSPAVLRLIQTIIQAAHKKGKWVGMCGELAGEALAIPVLIGMGIDELSMNAPAIPIAKKILRNISLEDAQRIAQTALELEDAQSIKAFLKDQDFNTH